MPPHLRVRPAAVGTLFLLLAGCAGNPKPMSPEIRSAELLSDRPPPGGRSCVIVDTPAELPRPSALMHLEALRTDLDALWQPGRDSTGYVLLSIGYDKFGTNIRRSVIEHNVSPAVADSIQKLVFHHRQTLEESEGDWGVRLRVELADPVRFEVGRQELCAPRPRDMSLALAMQSPFTPAGVRYRDGFRESTIWVRVGISPRGNVTTAAIERGVVSGNYMEQRIFDFVRSLFFEPALEDGVPVAGMLSIPVIVREVR